MLYIILAIKNQEQGRTHLLQFTAIYMIWIINRLLMTGRTKYPHQVNSGSVLKSRTKRPGTPTQTVGRVLSQGGILSDHQANGPIGLVV